MDTLSKTVAELPSAINKRQGAGRWKPILLATMVPIGMLAVIWFVFREQLVSAIPVETGRIILLEQENGSPSQTPTGVSEMQFQASGWVEPAPWHTSIAVKTDGFIEEVFFKEGESVTNGQILATLDSADAQLALNEAEAFVQKAEALLQASKSTAEAEAKQAEAAKFRVEAAVARLNRERDTSERFANASPGVISHTDRITAEQAVIEFEAEEKAARSALTALKAKALASETDVKVAEAALASAKENRAAAQLALDRTVIRSSVDGIVMLRFVKPGDKRMMGSDDPHSAHIAAIYNPKDLQIRVDVPIAEAGKLTIGQPTQIFTALLPGRSFAGQVTRIIGQADLQRNTLQAKVQVIDPDERLRPDVLCRVEFWSMPNQVGSSTLSSSAHALWIPEDALSSDASEQSIWIIDPLTQTAHQRAITLTSVSKNGFRQVADGLRANETVIIHTTEALQEGARVKEVSK
jgi:RND family efflux transporter MFP subunit